MSKAYLNPQDHMIRFAQTVVFQALVPRTRFGVAALIPCLPNHNYSPSIRDVERTHIGNRGSSAATATGKARA
jgi:hypothetical protein